MIFNLLYVDQRYIRRGENIIRALVRPMICVLMN